MGSLRQEFTAEDLTRIHTKTLIERAEYCCNSFAPDSYTRFRAQAALTELKRREAVRIDKRKAHLAWKKEYI